RAGARGRLLHGDGTPHDLDADRRRRAGGAQDPRVPAVGPAVAALRLGVVLALAAALRLAHVWALRDTPWFEHLVVDPGYYDLWAQHIAAGNWLGGDRAFYMDPLYPYVLGGLYRLFGRDLLAVRLVQVAMSVGSCALVARLGTM